MRKIKTYKEFKVINEEEEGWKEKALAASLAASSLVSPSELKAKEADLMNQPGIETTYQAPEKKDAADFRWPWQPKTKTLHKKVTSEEESEKLEKRHWSLDSVQVDTIWQEVIKQKPDTMVSIDELKFDDNQFFASGKYVLNQDMKDSLQSMINDIIEEGGIISAIQIESSTDKQGLSKRLQDELQGLGYSPDNSGLSKVRCDEVENHLIDLGVNDSLITSKQKVEAGTGTVDASARYVVVKVVYLDKDVVTTPEIIERVPEIKKVYYYSKEVEITKKKSKKQRHHKVRTHRTHIKYNPKKCFEF